MTNELNAPYVEPDLRAIDLEINPMLWRNVAMMLLWKFGQSGNQVAITREDENAMFADFQNGSPLMAICDGEAGGVVLALVTIEEAEAMDRAYQENREARGIPVRVGSSQ